ncbi:MAG: TrkA C-terminal domain-containing protein [Planctomycetaceae bacterium]
MIPIATLLVVLFLSLIVTRVGAMALVLTGLSHETARFQSRSAFSGVGYTTSEAESIVNHPVRRRIVMILMLLGNLGIGATVAASVPAMLQFSGSGSGWQSLLYLLIGLLILWLFANSQWVERWLNQLIAWSLRRFTRLDARDYVALLQLQQGFAVTEMHVRDDDWIADQTLKQLRLPDEGVIVLGLERRDGMYIGAPVADTKIVAGDKLVLYGPIRRVQELDERRKGLGGAEAHAEAVVEQREEIEELRSSMTLTELMPVRLDEQDK